MIINFGKFKGHSIESLKHSSDGISYLEWGAANLRDAKMRQAFAATLASLTDHETAGAISRSDGIGYDEALTHVRDMAAMEAEDAAAEQVEDERRAEVFRRWSAESGQSVGRLRLIASRLMTDWMVGYVPPRSQFSSDAAYEMFRRYMAELWG